MTLFSELQQLMIDHRFRPSQRFSQNFIIDENLINKMIETASLKKSDVVLEIGSGTGSLTQFLLKNCKVVGSELDEKMIGVLKERFSKEKKFKLVEGDFVKAELPKFNKVVSLPPYNISSDIMLRLFSLDFELAVLVFQREFTEKLVAEPGFKEYSYLSVLTDCFYKPSIVIPNISPKVFFPKSESYSSLLKLERKKPVETIKDFPKFVSFLKHVFRYKNKNFSNALKNCLKELNEDIDYAEVLSELELDGLKTNLLETKDFVAVFKRIFRE